MVPMIESIANELRDETVTTRRVLERVPADKLAWKPHQRSKSLGELAMHVASIPAMAERIAKHDEFAAGGGTPAVAGSAEEILAAFERNVRAAEEALDGMTEQTAAGSWRLIFRGKEVFSKPRVKALRTNMLNHMYHHRGQLTVYLRLLDVPVPMVYGPTADENPFT
jgi:uncharacterized damage-inducible protein DinB